MKTFQNQDEERHKKTESYLDKKHSEKYNSLAFGKTIVYKPESFNTLDSLYALKQEYIENDDLRELKTSGVEEMIQEYRPKAQEDIEEVEFEHEHIYNVEKDDSLQIFHDYFMFNYEDSIIAHTSLYNYKIPEKWEELHNSYLFNFHFITDRELYISGREREFLELFKSRESDLIGEPELQDFMLHTLKIMELANSINSIDYSKITRYIAVPKIQNTSTNPSIVEFGTLVALEDENENVLGYELSIKWKDELANETIKKETKIIFNIFLEIEEINTIII